MPRHNTTVSDKPGEAYRLLSKLASEKVNLLGLWRLVELQRRG